MWFTDGVFREVGLLQDHGLGLTEAVCRALGAFHAHVHGFLRWRQNQSRRLHCILEVRDSRREKKGFISQRDSEPSGHVMEGCFPSSLLQLAH